MEVNVKVTVDLGPATVGVIGKLFGANTLSASVPENCAEDTAEPAKEEKPTRTRSRAAKLAPEPVKEEAPATPAPEVGNPTTERPVAAPTGFEGMDDDAKLEVIRAEVSKNVKKGRSVDVKFMLAQFDADKAGSLDPKDYPAFYDAIVRYGKGEALEDIFPSDLD